jgi:hypothetical protein
MTGGMSEHIGRNMRAARWATRGNWQCRERGAPTDSAYCCSGRGRRVAPGGSGAGCVVWRRGI